MRKPIIAGNWKMNKTPKEARELVEALKPLVKDAKATVVVCVPAVDIAAAALQLSLEGEAGTREEEQAAFENTGGAPGMVRFFFNIGRAQKIRPADIVRAIASEADIPGDTIGVINIYEKFSFVEVPEKVAERVLSAMHRNTVNGFKVNVEPARKR